MHSSVGSFRAPGERCDDICVWMFVTTRHPWSIDFLSLQPHAGTCKHRGAPSHSTTDRAIGPKRREWHAAANADDVSDLAALGAFTCDASSRGRGLASWRLVCSSRLTPQVVAPPATAIVVCTPTQVFEATPLPPLGFECESARLGGSGGGADARPAASRVALGGVQGLGAGGQNEKIGRARPGGVKGSGAAVSTSSWGSHRARLAYDAKHRARTDGAMGGSRSIAQERLAPLRTPDTESFEDGGTQSHGWVGCVGGVVAPSLAMSWIGRDKGSSCAPASLMWDVQSAFAVAIGRTCAPAPRQGQLPVPMHSDPCA